MDGLPGSHRRGFEEGLTIGSWIGATGLLHAPRLAPDQRRRPGGGHLDFQILKKLGPQFRIYASHSLAYGLYLMNLIFNLYAYVDVPPAVARERKSQGVKGDD